MFELQSSNQMCPPEGGRRMCKLQPVIIPRGLTSTNVSY